MVVNFIDCNTLNWILIREEETTGSGFRGTTYADPHVILKRTEVYDEVSVDMGGTETKRYSPGVYRTTSKEGWQRG